MTCGVWGFTVQAHAKNGGMSRKADWTLTLPLCCSRETQEGCHEESHRGQKSFEAKYGVTLVELAARTQARWHAHATGARAISQGEE